ncbi:SecY-interacting protein Syd [Gorillibacterium sp. CAU 1737]|uniref:SecY-interacting protein Syd n=1 Tax=Gorillibacterium sp. CAU 1737 TaxID=3140362 RepID=UPI0032610E8E
MTQYFSLRKTVADEGVDFLFKTPFDDEADSLIYVGEVDEEDYISWRPVEKKVISDFHSLERKVGSPIHPSIVEYFHAYWFAELDGFMKDHYIKLEPVLPKTDIEAYGNFLMGYQNNHNNRLANIPIGMEGNGLLVVVDNQDGSVNLEDFERNSFEKISESMEQLILALRLKK